MDKYPRIRKYLAIVIILLFVGTCFIPGIAQDGGKLLLPTPTEWTRTFGGEYNDYGYSVQQTIEGGYIIAGETEIERSGEVSPDVWLIKIDGNGTKVWDKTFGGTNLESGRSVQQTADGGYIITGFKLYYTEGDCDVWLIKTDSNGDMVWDKTFWTTDWSFGLSVQQTTDGGYIIAGETAYNYETDAGDVWLIKTDDTGNKMWDKTFGGTKQDLGYSVQQTADGGYIIVGITAYDYHAWTGDMWLIKTDRNGNKVWDKTFGGTQYDEGRSVQQTSDGGYIITGVTFSKGKGENDVWLIKTDENGKTEWDTTFGGKSYDYGYFIQQTADGGFIITGETMSKGKGEFDVWLIKTDENGKTEWDRTFGGTEYEYGYSVRQTTDSGYIVTGVTTSFGHANYCYDMWLIKTDSEGKSKTISLDNSWLQKLFEQFPNGFLILRPLVKYSSGSGLFTQRWPTFTSKQDNNPPNKPSNPSPPNQATNVDINTDLSWTGGDPDVGDTVTYDIYFGSVFPLQKLASNISTLSYNPEILAYGELYRWIIVSWDNHGLSTQGPTWWFRTKWDFGYPPNKPSQPSGQINGIVGKEYVYTTSTTDPEGDMVYYLWDWGDGNNSGWSQAYFSGTTVGVKHMWTVEGSYNLRVKAKDMTEQEGPWSDPLPLTIPHSYKSIQLFLESLFQRFPHAFPLLRHLLGY